MPSPFPGMDPYLEDSEIWRGFHHLLADEIITQLNPRIGPKYFADVEVRTIREDVLIATIDTFFPDAAVLKRTPPPLLYGGEALAIAIPEAPLKRMIKIEDQIKLRTIEIKVTETGTLVTALELLSPYNKRPGKGSQTYRQKRRTLLHSAIHFIEIDLLRGGERPGFEVNEPPVATDYILLVNRNGNGGNTRISEIWPVALNEPLPLLPVPLLPPDPDVPLNLGAALQSVYTRAGYDWRINYQRPLPPPALRPDMTSWLREVLPEVGKGSTKI